MAMPRVSNAQPTAWKAAAGKTLIFANESSSRSVTSTLQTPRQPASNQPFFVKQPQRQQARPTNPVPCSQFEWTTGLMLEMSSGDSVVRFSYMEKCDQPLAKTMAFKAQQIGEPDLLHWYEGSLEREGRTYAMLEGKTSLELLSGQAPFGYRLDFEMTFAPDAQFRRFLEGQPVDESTLITIRGQTEFTPRVTCNSKAVGYDFDSSLNKEFESIDSLFCSPFLGYGKP